MPRLTVTISEEHERILEEQSDVGGAYRSKSEVVREAIEAHERVDDLSNQLACLEAEVESLRDQRSQLQQKAQRVEELEDKLWDLQMEYQELIHEAETDVDTTASERNQADAGVTIERDLGVNRGGFVSRLKSTLFGTVRGNR